ncbi:MAG: bifunctional hydroxymethylpyrimidine kinase/phosphomethylpyrimidine kinase, partial [Promethearchaeota archaeon]
KTGMLSNAEIIQVVADRASLYNVELLIVDPVMIAKSGDPLLKAEANSTLISKIVPLAHVITPNLHEAHILTGIEINNINEVQESAVKIFEMGAKNVVVKGGHLQDINESIDILYDGKKFIEFRSPRVNTNNTHGTGCTFASGIAAELAKGKDIKDAVHIAKAYLTNAIQRADNLHIGKGHGPTDHSLGNEVKVNLDIVSVREI